MTPPMKAALEATGRFPVDVATTPGAEGPEGRLGRLSPRFLEIRRRPEQLQRPALARAGAEGVGGVCLEGRRARRHPRGQQRLRRLARVERDDRARLAGHHVRRPDHPRRPGQGRPHAQGRRPRRGPRAAALPTRSPSATPTTRSPRECPPNGCTPRTSCITASAGPPRRCTSWPPPTRQGRRRHRLERADDLDDPLRQGAGLHDGDGPRRRRRDGRRSVASASRRPSPGVASGRPPAR